MTAADLIARLQELPPETVIFTVRYDDWSTGYDTSSSGIGGVSDDGRIQLGKFLRAWDSYTGRGEED